MTTKHATCTHPSTSAARAACRKAQGSLSPSATSRPCRSDIHRPAVFQPEDYTFSHCGSRAEDTDPWTRRIAAEALRRLIDQGHRWAAHHGAGKCDHCGTGILHYAVMIHRPTGELIEIGETCLDGRFEMANTEFRDMQKRLKAARVGRAKQARIAALIEEHPLLAGLQAIHNDSMDNSFLGSIASQFITKGELSEKQIAAAERAILRDAHTEALRENAARDRADRDLAPLTAGKRTITGTIKSTKWQDNAYGTGSLKCLIEDADGYRYWGTVPSAFENPEAGREITLTATVEPKDDDPTFAFYKRPRLV